MKLKLTFLFLLLIPIQIYSNPQYFYKGEKIELKVRGDKIALILKSNISESYLKTKLNRYFSEGEVLKKALPEVYILNFSSRKTSAELENVLSAISSQTNIIKFATEVYYGTSRQVTEIPTDKFIVRLRSAKDLDKLNTLNVQNSCTIIGKIKDDRGFLLQSNQEVRKNAVELSDIYYSSGILEYAEPDFLYPDKCLLLSVPNDIFFPSQWALNNTGQLLTTGSPFLAQGDAPTVNGITNSDMNVLGAWNYTTGSPLIKIGIIDTGIDSLHADLQSPGHLLCGYDAYNNLNSSATDIANHGTAAAGLIGAVMNNLIGISGVAPGCRLMSISIFDMNGNTSNSVIARAFDTARVRGIGILSDSWGGGTPDQTITDAIDNAAINGRGGLGCVIFFGSGNDGKDPPVYPSDLPNVLCVGASTPHDQKKAPGTGNEFYWGSNYGEDNIGDLDLTAPTNCYTLSSGGGYNPNFTGTSACCPNAAGVAALILSVNNTFTRSQVVDNILRGCDKIDNVPYSVTKTYGRWNNFYGYGRVNALNSVRLAAGVDLVPPTINHLSVSSRTSTYPVNVLAEIIDQNGASVPISGNDIPKLFYKIKKNSGSWSPFDSLPAYSIAGNFFTFRIPSQGWETEVQYYIRARDNFGNETTFPKHAPNPFWLCYFAIGNITSEFQKVPSFRGADFGATMSPSVNFGSLKIIGTKVKIYMRQTYLDDEIIQVVAPFSDANNNRKCLFSTNGADMDNITGAWVSDSATALWYSGTPPYTNGGFKPEFSMKGYDGQNGGGAWEILHFDRSVGDYAFFDSVKIILFRTTGVTSSSARLNTPEDSILFFDSAMVPGVYTKNFYLKNSGTATLTTGTVSFSGASASLFSIINTPPAYIAPNDSGLFKVKLNSASANPGGNFEMATLNIPTNDPSKGLFKVSLQTNVAKNLQLKALIEGLYNSSGQTSIPDTLTVYLRNANAPYTIADSARSVINSAGIGSFDFSGAQNSVNYFIVVRHRNALETWSASANSFNSSVMNYDFTVDSSAAYGNNLILKGFKYCLYSGDVQQDGQIDVSDIISVYNSAVNFNSGYLPEDINGDNFVDISDLITTYNNSRDFIHLIRP